MRAALIDLGSDTESSFTEPVASVFAESAAVDDDCSPSSGSTGFPTPGPGKQLYSETAGCPKSQAKKAKVDKQVGGVLHKLMYMYYIRCTVILHTERCILYMEALYVYRVGY